MKSGDGIDEWRSVLPSHVVQKSEELLARVEEMRINQVIYPPQDDVLNALASCAPSEVRAVILGQDPYHGPGQAMGLSFSVPAGEKLPPSLRNIYKEMVSDLGCGMPKSGDLTPWANQGVLLLNTVLTVRAHQPNSHKGKGWEILTDRIISELNHKTTPVVFLLWGANARSKKKLITNPQHVILETVHPSPLSAYGGFFGCRHFSQANRVLEQSGQVPIDWTVR